jgi:hypothetical protein
MVFAQIFYCSNEVSMVFAQIFYCTDEVSMVLHLPVTLSMVSGPGPAHFRSSLLRVVTSPQDRMFVKILGGPRNR